MPQEVARVQLGPGEVAHASIAPVGITGYFGQDKQYRSSFFLIGGPVGLAVTGAASLAYNASKKAEAQRAAKPSWHQLGTADIVVTNQRLIATGSGRTESLWYAEIGPLQLVPGRGGAPGVQFQPRTGPCSGSRRHGRRCSTCSCTTSSTGGLRASRCPPGWSNAPGSRAGSAEDVGFVARGVTLLGEEALALVAVVRLEVAEHSRP